MVVATDISHINVCNLRKQTPFNDNPLLNRQLQSFSARNERHIAHSVNLGIPHTATEAQIFL